MQKGETTFPTKHVKDETAPMEDSPFISILGSTRTCHLSASLVCAVVKAGHLDCLGGAWLLGL